jgi:hypothetical protein
MALEKFKLAEAGATVVGTARTESRLGDVEHLGRLCVYLSTRDCYATNAIFHVDGGVDSDNSPLPIPDH